MQDWQENRGRERRFGAYVEALVDAVGHADRREPLVAYLTGLMTVEGRKSVEPMAAAVAVDSQSVSARRQSMTHFVGRAPWSDVAMLDAAFLHAQEPVLCHGPILALLLDDTGIPKKGSHSVAVSRQYCGNTGKVDNCQVAVSLSVVNELASLPVGYRLYLPKVWAEDPDRRAKVGVPAEIAFQTKPEIALDLLEAHLGAGRPVAPVTADAGYGDSTHFRDALTALGLPYLVGVKGGTSVWPPDQGPLPLEPVHPRRKRLGRDPTHQPVTAGALAESLPDRAFREVIWRDGTKGDLTSRFAVRRVRPAHGDEDLTEARPEEWLLVEWPLAEEQPTHFWLGTLDAGASLQELVEFAKLRWRIERDYEELKQELGLDHYEGRSWRGFHHHASLCIAAYAFLVAERAAFSPLGPRGGAGFLPQPALPRDYRPRGATSQPAPPADVDRHAARPNRTKPQPQAAPLPGLRAPSPATRKPREDSSSR